MVYFLIQILHYFLKLFWKCFPLLSGQPKPVYTVVQAQREDELSFVVNAREGKVSLRATTAERQAEWLRKCVESQTWSYQKRIKTYSTFFNWKSAPLEQCVQDFFKRLPSLIFTRYSKNGSLDSAKITIIAVFSRNLATLKNSK